MYAINMYGKHILSIANQFFWFLLACCDLLSANFLSNFTFHSTTKVGMVFAAKQYHHFTLQRNRLAFMAQNLTTENKYSRKQYTTQLTIWLLCNCTASFRIGRIGVPDMLSVSCSSEAEESECPWYFVYSYFPNI